MPASAMPPELAPPKATRYPQSTLGTFLHKITSLRQGEVKVCLIHRNKPKGRQNETEAYAPNEKIRQNLRTEQNGDKQQT